jgi:hypothetical protein
MGRDAILSTQSAGAEVMPKKRVIPAAPRAAIEVVRARADERVAKLVPIIKSIQAKGVTSLRAIAEALNERRVPTPRAEAVGMRRRCGARWRGWRRERRRRRI